MATKKNPLSALLDSDKRQQAQDFSRDYSVRSAVRQAGTYGVAVQPVIPASQTGLGRLSSALSTVSGILNQFSEYQLNKEKAELQLQGVKQDIELTGIRSEQLHETVKQQNIKLGEISQRRADIEFDNYYRNLSSEQKRELGEQIKNNTETTKKELDLAEIQLQNQEPEAFENSSLFDKRAKRLVGANEAPNYKVYFEQRKQQILAELPGNPDGPSLTAEQALSISESIYNDYIKENAIDPASEYGKGFNGAISSYNSSNIPTLAADLKARSKVLYEQNAFNSANNYAEKMLITETDSDGNQIERERTLDDLRGEDWFKDLAAEKSPEKVFAFITGTKGDPNLGIQPKIGLEGYMSRDAKSAARYVNLLEELGETLTINGKPMNEDVRYDAALAEAEQKAEALSREEIRQESSLYSKALEDIKPALIKAAFGASPAKIAEVSASITNPDSTPSEIRQKMLENIPGIEPFLNDVSDDRILQFGMEMSINLKRAQELDSSTTDTLVNDAVPGFQNYSLEGPLRQVLLTAKGLFDEKSGIESAESALMSAYLTGSFATGMNQAVSGISVVSEFDRDSGGLIKQYQEDLNNSVRKVRKQLGNELGTESDAFKEKLGEELTSLNDKFLRDIQGYAKSKVRESQRFIKAVEENDGAWLEERNLLDATLYEKEEVKKFLQNDPTRTPQEALSLLTRFDADTFERLDNKKAPLIRTFEAKTKEEADNYDATVYNIKRNADKSLDIFTKPGGKYYKELCQLTDKIAISDTELSYWLSFTTPNKIEKKYRNLIAGVEDSLQRKYGNVVDIDEITEVANMASFSPKMLGVKIPVIPSDFWLNKPEGIYEFRERAYHQSGYIKNSDGSLRTSSFWYRMERPAGLPRDFFERTKPFLRGINFGKKAPTERDVEYIITNSGMTPQSFRNIHKLYGFENGLDFLKYQYNTPYYSNKRTSSKK